MPTALTVVALSIGAQGRHAEAVAAYDEVLPVFGRIFGAGHRETLKLRSDRAQQLAALGRHPECEAECAAVALAATRGAGPEMRFIAAAANNAVGFALNAQGRHVEAEALAREVLAEVHEPARLRLALWLGLARSLNGRARYEEALAEAASADAPHRDVPSEYRGHEGGSVELVVANALLGLGREAEARVRAGSAHDALPASFGPAHHRTVEARALLGRLDGA